MGFWRFSPLGQFNSTTCLNFTEYIDIKYYADYIDYYGSIVSRDYRDYYESPSCRRTLTFTAVEGF
jgi:hypothetical protein